MRKIREGVSWKEKLRLEVWDVALAAFILKCLLEACGPDTLVVW